MGFIEGAATPKTATQEQHISQGAVVTGSALHNASTGEKAEIVPSPIAKGLDIDKLAYCVAVAETNDCTKGMGLTKNNCFGIMTWERGFREGRRYNSKEESYEDFKRIWLKSYKTFPTYSMAVKWTGNDNASRWLGTVKQCYNS